MKIQKIKSLCTKSATIVVYETAGSLWIGDGAGIYPVYNLPQLTNEQIYTLFDIPEDKRGKVRISRQPLPSAGLNFDDNDLFEKPLERVPLGIEYAGDKLLPFIGEDKRIIYIKADHLTPFADLKDGYGLYLRSDSRVRYVAVKKGLILIGIIIPCSVESQDIFVNAINDIFCSPGFKHVYEAVNVAEEMDGVAEETFDTFAEDYEKDGAEQSKIQPFEEKADTVPF